MGVVRLWLIRGSILLPPDAPLLSPTDQKTPRLKMVSVGDNLSIGVQLTVESVQNLELKSKVDRL